MVMRKIFLEQVRQSGASLNDAIVWDGSGWSANALAISNVSGLQSALDAKVDDGPIISSGLTQSSGTLLGRTTASSGAVEEITVGAGLSFTGGQLGLDQSSGWISSVTAVGTAVSQDITLPESGLSELDVLVFVNGLRYEADEYTIAGTTLTITTNDVGDSIEIIRASSAGNVFNEASARSAINVAPTTIGAATYTLALVDYGQYLRLTNAGGCAVTVPPNTSVAFPVGTTITLRAATAGTCSLVEGSGVTLNLPGGPAGTLNFVEEGATVQVKKVATNEWDVIGGMGG